ncbi:hypothetical protein B0H12DRAFT_1279320 [Mycena haematopus]|nr:hypothetical protein B0H12DRAFT_1279320 [Mycena haematopus]
MFSSALLTLLLLAAHASAHAMPPPALDVAGVPVRNDVQRPSTAQPCGSVPIAANLDNSTGVPVKADGMTDMLNVTNFNPGPDGNEVHRWDGQEFVPSRALSLFDFHFASSGSSTDGSSSSSGSIPAVMGTGKVPCTENCEPAVCKHAAVGTTPIRGENHNDLEVSL